MKNICLGLHGQIWLQILHGGFFHTWLAITYTPKLFLGGYWREIVGSVSPGHSSIFEIDSVLVSILKLKLKLTFS